MKSGGARASSPAAPRSACCPQVRDGRPFDAALDRALRALAEPDRRLAHELAAGVLRQPEPRSTRGSRRWCRAGWAERRARAQGRAPARRLPAHRARSGPRARGGRHQRDAGQGGRRRAGRRVRERGAAAGGRLRRGRARQRRPAVTRRPIRGRWPSAASHPPWLVERWLARFGPDGDRGAAPLEQHPPAAGAAAGARAGRGARAPLARRGHRGRRRRRSAPGSSPTAPAPADLPGYRRGRVHRAGPGAGAARLVRRPAAGRRRSTTPARRPGGKAITLGRGAARVRGGRREPARGCGAWPRTSGAPAAAGSSRSSPTPRAPPVRPVDAVLLDAPCLGTGTFARHPDARWRVTPEALASLAAAPGRAARPGAATVVAPGGLLLYATCSIEPEENERQVERFLAAAPRVPARAERDVSRRPARRPRET